MRDDRPAPRLCPGAVRLAPFGVTQDLSSPGQRILAIHRRLDGRPGGSWIFRRIMARMVPYTGSIKPTVEELTPGHARVSMRDRRAVRNHLGSVHAIALANLGEFASGLASLTGLPGDVRGIVVGLHVEYLKKARGRLVAESHSSAPDPAMDAPVDHTVVAEITDGDGDVVARVTADWHLSPR